MKQQKTKLVFATHNPNKLTEIKAMLPNHIELLSLQDIGCTEEIPETADTIEGNALQKAAYIRHHYDYDCIADDTGLEVEALGGAPGVFSARYAGEEKDNEANILKLLKNLRNKENRRAQFKTVIALNFENDQNIFTGICKGEIIKSKRGKGGFGYDPVFQPDEYDITFAEMSLIQKSQLSHRGKAFRALISYLTK